MTESIRAARASVQIGSQQIDGFMLPDGSYRMSQAQVAQAVDKPPVNALRFLGSKAIKSLLGQGYTDYTPEQIEIESEEGKRGQSRFNALPLEVATAYWVNQCFQGNKQALALVMALATETLERRFDNAFGVSRTETERNERLSQRNQQFERALAELGEGFALDDQIRQERDYFERLLRENGIDPWGLPENE
ncbi:MAG: hypothetical protein F6K47_36885, partial [Symploca sp. SIO2E6]|nr:hypothetical protein [Symploca sp. SIO2E6]